MANSANFVTDNKYIVYWIECIQNSQNITNNTSNVTIKVWVKRTNTGYTTYGSGTCYCKINGTTYSASITSSQKITSSAITLFTKTMDIGHNSDGTKTLNMSAWIKHSQFSSSEQSYNQGLTTIPRTSNITVTSSVNAGSAVTINIDRKSSNFTHKVYYTFGNKSATISTNATTSASYTIPIDHCTVIPNSTSGTATIRCETWNGSSKVGQVSKTFTVNVPSSVVPSITSLGTSESGTGLGVYVQSKSRVVVNVGASYKYGATYKSCTITVGNSSASGTNWTTGIINSSGNFTVKATITDSRGRTATSSKTIYFEPYNTPKLSISAFRSDSQGIENATEGDHAKVTVKSTVSSVANKNTGSHKLEYRVANGTWIQATTWSGTSLNTTHLISGINVDNSYEIRLSTTDKWGTVSTQTVVSTAFVLIDCKSGGKGIAIGKVSQENKFEVGIESLFHNTIGVRCKGDGKTLMVFDTERSWSIKQGGTEASATLDLVSNTNGKSFRIMDSTQKYRAEFYTQDGSVSLNLDGHIDAKGNMEIDVTHGERRFGFKSQGVTTCYFYGQNTGRVGAFDAKNKRGVFFYEQANNHIVLQTLTRPQTNNAQDFGTSAVRWRTLYAVNALNTSDKKYKENIEYLRDHPQLLNEANDEIITPRNIYNFIRDRFNLATYNYKGQNHSEIGFVADDLAKDTIGKYLIIGDGVEEDYLYSTGSYISFIAMGLQEEIKIRDYQMLELKQELKIRDKQILELKQEIDTIKDILKEKGILD